MLKSFEPLIASTRRLVDACYTFSHPVRLLYTSSVSAAAGYDTSLGPVPEEPLADPEVAVATGYGASKFVVENVRVLHETLERLLLRLVVAIRCWPKWQIAVSLRRPYVLDKFAAAKKQVLGVLPSGSLCW